MEFPFTLSELHQTVTDFERHSVHRIFNRCIGALYGCCDASCTFNSLSVLCHGGMSDSKAFYSSKTYNLVEQHPEGFYVLADNAYCLSSTLHIPYSGREKQDKSKDAFNFFLSQSHI
jgi:hypothetical protein